MTNQVLEVAIEAARRASQATLVAFERKVDVVQKKDGTPVTLADLTAQAVLLSHLESELGPQQVWAEESGTELVDDQLETIIALAQAIDVELTADQVHSALSRRRPPAGEYWAVDPLDGTRGFVRGDQWAVAVARVRNGQPDLAVVGLPRFGPQGVEVGDGRLLWAERGQGAWQRPLAGGEARRIAARSPATEPFRIAESAEYQHTIRVAENGRPSFKWTSLKADGQVKYGLLATDRADLYVRAPRSKTYREKVWDHAPGSLIAEECGLRVADFAGDALDFSKPPHFKPHRGIFAGPRAQWDELMTKSPSAPTGDLPAKM